MDGEFERFRRQYHTKTVMYPVSEVYDAKDHDEVIAMLRSSGDMEQTDSELLAKLVRVSIITRIA